MSIEAKVRRLELDQKRLGIKEGFYALRKSRQDSAIVPHALKLYRVRFWPTIMYLALCLVVTSEKAKTFSNGSLSGFVHLHDVRFPRFIRFHNKKNNGKRTLMI